MDSVALRGFRAALRASFGRRADALFELCDAVLTSGPAKRYPAVKKGAYTASQWSSRGIPTLPAGLPRLKAS
ncbi:MAG: hypothetical protein AVDCRST_MAG01-01-2485 [uncultured Rubrobacteraceae bacterium]|uniref:Uncharacterized protein n=1 Tax=uncultured Rubrobacteraceae bacterium TaxID=349277 RepID=A0A6J4PV46_9ACTN|nr:MAG: hypothetical protein AVDCRST_MAG01-01-2485 [uncultured Rubrobacteraceae bacterium]